MRINEQCIISVQDFSPEPSAKVQIKFVNRHFIIKKMYKNSIWMAKKHGNWRFLCNFVGMKQTLEDYIRHAKVFRQALLDQECGIIKYLAKHPDGDFDTDLFFNYEKQIVEEDLQTNKRNRAVCSLLADTLKWDALSLYQKKWMIFLKSNNGE